MCLVCMLRPVDNIVSTHPHGASFADSPPPVTHITQWELFYLQVCAILIDAAGNKCLGNRAQATLPVLCDWHSEVAAATHRGVAD